ncbi:MAG: PQQ-dependent sugar dehydrogenase [Pseudomonadota bacterium]
MGSWRVSPKRTAIVISTVLAVALTYAYWYLTTRDNREFSRVTYAEHCASCHGEQLQGGVAHTNLMANALQYGDSTELLMQSISRDLAAHTTVEWLKQASPTATKALALYIGERRRHYPAIAASYQQTFSQRTVNSLHHRFHVEQYSALDSRPYSIAPLPNGDILVSEKTRGLSIVDESGKQGRVIDGAPAAFEQFLTVQGSYVGWGQYLDVAIHPDYSNNGWVYLSYADRCQLDCRSLIPQSMVKVVRGRVRDGKWLDQQTIWSVHKEYYTVVPDGVAGGRLGFDKTGHVYVSVGGKAHYKHLHDIDTPYGKIHRVKDDGAIPDDNPFWLADDKRSMSSTRNTVWSIGHRTTQGLDGHPLSGEIWSSEMGPRGGDEVNRIVAGGNYGWPLYTNGLDYDSTEVSIGKDLGLNFPIEDTVLPAVDFTPAPALSNLTFHSGQRFTGWENDLLIGSLKALSLYRLRLAGNQLLEKETLVSELGRIRDVAMGVDGLVYIALEHGDTGSIVRLVPQAHE